MHLLYDDKLTIFYDAQDGQINVPLDELEINSGSSKGQIVGLTGTDSNHFDALLRFKKSVAAMVPEAGQNKGLLSAARKIDEYGEIAVSRIQQAQIRLGEEELNLLIAAYLGGKSTYALAEQFGCHRTTVSNILKRYGVACH